MTRPAPDVVVDVAIFGGGIAGLWLLDVVRRAGHSAVLFEAHALGRGQSVASQGIIHGGAKYTFGFALDSAVRELREMPATWSAALDGAAGQPDLRQARVLSDQTYMWLPRQLGGGLLGAFSRLVMRSRMQRIPREQWPDGLQSDAPGSVYALDERVFDVPSVIAALRDTHRDAVRAIPGGEAPAITDGRVRVGDVVVDAQRFVLTAGAGNETLMRAAGIEGVGAQRRPLHQVLVAGMKPAVYAHCVGRSTKPVATVTSHPTPDGDHVWNVGGDLAEQGASSEPEALIETARRTLPPLFPGADFGAARYAAFRVDRAEGAVEGGGRPGGPMIAERDDVIVAWPTKLALAPVLADRVLGSLAKSIRAVAPQIEALASLPEPEVARPPWEGVASWS